MSQKQIKKQPSFSRSIPLALILLLALFAFGCQSTEVNEDTKTDSAGDTMGSVKVYEDIDSFTAVDHSKKIPYSASKDKDIYKVLAGAEYSMIQEPDTKVVSIFTVLNDQIIQEEFAAKPDETLPLKLTKNSDVYISLHANRTVLYDWTLEGLPSEKSWIEIPSPKSIEGQNFDRQVFKLDLSKLSDVPLKMTYAHLEEERTDAFAFEIMLSFEE